MARPHARDDAVHAGRRAIRRAVLAECGRSRPSVGTTMPSVALEEARQMPDLARWYGRPVVVAAGAALLEGDADGVDRAIAAAPGIMPMDIALMRLVGADVIGGEARVRWLREALDTYEKAGAPLAADRVRQALRDAGGPVPRRRRQAGASARRARQRGGDGARGRRAPAGRRRTAERRDRGAPLSCRCARSRRTSRRCSPSCTPATAAQLPRTAGHLALCRLGPVVSRMWAARARSVDEAA